MQGGEFDYLMRSMSKGQEKRESEQNSTALLTALLSYLGQ